MADNPTQQAPAPQGPTPSQVLQDGKFWALAENDRRSVLGQVDPNFNGLSDEDKTSVLTTAQQSYQQKHAGEGTISAAPKLGLADQLTGKPGSWLDQAERDITQGARPGFDRTIVGKVLHGVGLPRTGTAPDTANDASQFMGKTLAAPIEATKAVGELVTGHPVRAVNKAVGAVSDLGPAGLALAPEASLPTMIPTLIGGVAGQKVANAAADAAGVTDEDYRDLAGNVGGVVGGGLVHGKLNPKVASTEKPNIPLARKFGQMVGRGGAATVDTAGRAAVAAAPTLAKVAAAGVGGAAVVADQAASFGRGVAEGAGGYVNDKYVPSVDQIKTSMADAVHKAVQNPSVKGIMSDLTDIIKEHAGNAQDIVQKAPELAKSMLDKIQTHAETPKDVTVNLVDKAVDHTVNEEWLHPDSLKQEVVNSAKNKIADLKGWGPGISDAWDKAMNAVSDAVQNAKSFPEHSEPIAAALKDGLNNIVDKAGDSGSAVKRKIVNLALDEYNRWTNPSVSGGSFDADKIPEPSFRERAEAPWSDQLPNNEVSQMRDDSSPRGTMAANDPQAVGKTVSSDNIPRSTVNEDVGVGSDNQPLRTPLAELADKEDWAQGIKKYLTRGQVNGGGWQSLETELRRAPKFGRLFGEAQNDIMINGEDSKIKNMLVNAAQDPSLGTNARNILRQAAVDQDTTGRINLPKVIQRINAGLRDPGTFKIFDPPGTLSGDATQRMTLMRDALQQLHTDIDSTTKVGSEAANAASGSIKAGAMGFLRSLKYKTLIGLLRNQGIDGPEANRFSRIIANFPVVPEKATALYHIVVNEAKGTGVLPRFTREPIEWMGTQLSDKKFDYSKTEEYQKLSLEDKRLVDRAAEGIITKLGRALKGVSMPGQPVRSIKPGQAPLPSTRPEFNIAKNQNQDDNQGTVA